MSKSTKQKLFDLRKELRPVEKGKTNPFHKNKYFDVNDLIDYLQPYLNEYNFLLTQPVKDNKVYSILYDLDNDKEEFSAIELPQEDNPQKIGSAITYYRRYTLQSLLALEAEDDDGNKAAGYEKKSNKGWQMGRSKATELWNLAQEKGLSKEEYEREVEIAGASSPSKLTEKQFLGLKAKLKGAK